MPRHETQTVLQIVVAKHQLCLLLEVLWPLFASSLPSASSSSAAATAEPAAPNAAAAAAVAAMP